MTHHDLDLSALLQTVRSRDVTEKIRTNRQRVLQALIEADATAVVGAGPHERIEARSNQRNGGVGRAYVPGAVEAALCPSCG